MQKKKERSELALALGKCRAAFLGAAVFSFFINLLMLVSPIYMLQIYDRVLNSRNETTLAVLTGICVALMVVYGALEMVRAQVLVRVGGRMDDLLNRRVFEAIFKLAVENPAAASPQSLRDLDALRQYLTGQGLFAFFDAPWIPIFYVAVFMIHPTLGILSVIGGFVILALALANEMATRSTLGEATKSNISASRFVETSIRNVEALQAMGMVGAMYQRWSGRHKRTLQYQAAASDRAGVLTAGSKFVRITLQMLVLGVGAFLVIHNELTAGMMIGASIIMGRALAPIEVAVATWPQFLATRAAYARLVSLFEYIPPSAAPMPLPAPRGELAVENLIVIPPGAKTPALRGLSFRIAAGDVVGVIGPSAAGKSTLARALVGVWPAATGTVRVDGGDIKTWDRERLGPSIGYLPQDVELFEGTVAENIARFGPIDPDATVEAANRAGVHQLILNLSNGYDTQIGAGGQALSGGQRQRVGLARALYRDPPILILDEPNSNLDTDGEAALARSIAQLKDQRRTTVVITHRLNILASVDYIMVLNQGVIEKFGPRDQILALFLQPNAVAAAPAPAQVTAR
jgi:PrtD family type I secretion system ABC transporter